MLTLLYKIGGMQSRLPVGFETLGLAGVVVIAAIIFARLFAMVTEDRTRQLRGFLLRLLKIRKPQPATI